MKEKTFFIRKNSLYFRIERVSNSKWWFKCRETGYKCFIMHCHCIFFVFFCCSAAYRPYIGPNYRRKYIKFCLQYENLLKSKCVNSRFNIYFVLFHSFIFFFFCLFNSAESWGHNVFSARIDCGLLSSKKKTASIFHEERPTIESLMRLAMFPVLRCTVAIFGARQPRIHPCVSEWIECKMHFASTNLYANFVSN